MDADVVQRLGEIVEWKDSHLIFQNNKWRFMFQRAIFKSHYVRFFQKNGKEVDVKRFLKKMCDVDCCVEHWIEVPFTKRKQPDMSDQGDDAELKLVDLPEDYRLSVLKQIESNSTPGDPKSNIPGRCQLWNGFISPEGYGTISVCSKMHKLHRASYQLYNLAEIPPGHLIRHLCGNRACSAKDHLATGTPTENAADRISTGTARVGESHAQCVHTDEMVLQVYNSRGTLTIRECAEKFGCTESFVGLVRAGHRRNDVTGVPKRKRPKLTRHELRKEDETEAKQYIEERHVKWTDPEDGQVHWLWRREQLSSAGYGLATFHNIKYPAHVFSYRAYHSCTRIPPGHLVRHGCKYRNCVNPDHLCTGTNTENMADKIRDGTDCRGDKHSSAKLTESYVRHLKAIQGVTTLVERAKMFGISAPTICDIDKGRTWGHVKHDDNYDDTNDDYGEWKMEEDMITPTNREWTTT